jgi:hypothetical protein
MTVLPHDVVDLHLAPVVLRVDARLDELGLLDVRQLAERVSIEANMSLGRRPMRERALLLTVLYLLDTHGWQLSWHARGIELRHGAHALVLGVPPIFHEFLSADVRTQD